MKKTTKILSIFMAALMVFSCIPMTVFAQDRDTSSLDAYLDNENLAVVAETLLTDLGERSEDIVPTILNLVFQLVPDLKSFAEADGKSVFNMTSEELAGYLIKYIDKMLEEADLNSKIPSVVVGLLPTIGISNLDLSSVNTILQVVVDVEDILKDPPILAQIAQIKDFGELKNLDVSSLEVSNGRAVSTKNSSNLDILYALFGFLSNSSNIEIIKHAILGKLDAGSANNAIDKLAGFNIEETVNGFMTNLDVTIKEQIYNGLLAEKEIIDNGDGTTTTNILTAYADSLYVDFTADELLAAALIKVISGADATKAEAAKAADMNLYELIGAYADATIAKYAVEPLNTTVKDALKKLCDMDPQLNVLKNILNLDYEFKADTFNFAEMAEDGLFENLNNIVCKIAEVILQPSVYAELGLKVGGNENITANLKAVFGYILKTLASNNGGKLTFTINGTAYEYDFSQFTEENLADKSLEDMVVAVLRLFYVDWFGAPAPADADTLEKLGAYTAYTAIDKFMPDDFVFAADYKDLVYNNDGSIREISQPQWFDVIGTMGMDVAVYWLNKYTNFGMTQDEAKAFKADGWTWEDFFEDIVDWAVNYIDGIPAVADVLSTERGVKDGYGAWYKLNTILNELIPLGFVNGSGDETFTVDTYTFLMEKAAPSIFECDFGAFADILAMNNRDDNPFNKSVISSTLGLVDGLLFALFEHECGTAKNFEKPATATHNGYKGTYDSSNGHYIEVTVIPATGSDDTTAEPTEPTTEPTTQPTTKPTTEPTTQPTTKPTTEPTTQPTTKPTTEPTTQPTTKPTTEPTTEPTYTLGDINEDGKITAADARVALRISAKLESGTEKQLLAADTDKNGRITASDARKILRVAANLDKF